jgi:hypothetical protein
METTTPKGQKRRAQQLSWSTVARELSKRKKTTNQDEEREETAN